MIICITIHGVRSRGKWQKDFDKYIRDSGRTDIYHIPYSYGWIWAFPILWKWYRKKHIKKFRKFLQRKIYPLYNGLDIYIVAHSFGSVVSFWASIKTNIQIKKLILFGAVLKCRTDFEDVIPEVIKEVHNFHSLEDEVTKYNPLGHCGFWGFRNKKTKKKKWHRKPYKNLNVINHRLFLAEHTEYFPNKFSDILKLI